MTVEYGGQLFETSVFLVLCNRAVAMVFSFVMMIWSREAFGLKAPALSYMAISLSNVWASTCQYEALKYVSFAVQMLAKSFKMIPVMLWGMVINGKRYAMIDWLIAIIVTLGVTGFLLAGPIEAGDEDGGTAKPIKGLVLLLCFLALDGLTSNMQEKLLKHYEVSKYNTMFYVNLCSCMVSLFTLTTSRSLWTALDFCSAHPDFVRDAVVLSSSAVSGQWFIYSQIREFGALVFAATMNVRQLVSILASNQTFEHSVTFGQVIGMCMVFGALFLKSYIGLTAQATDEASRDVTVQSKDVETAIESKGGKKA
jgi:adenosine 3'-phospho 5'-phosphosulfate transporter B2